MAAIMFHRPRRALVKTTLVATEQAPAQARAMLRDALARRDLGDLAYDVVLVTDELVTNAIQYAGGLVRLVVRLRRGMVLCEVSDSSPVPPRQFRAQWRSEHGRGMIIVAALATDMGVRAGRHGKTCWCALATDGRRSA